MRHLAAALCLLSAPAFAQSNPSFITGQIPTAAQWNSYFGKKADVTGGMINNGVLNSVTINGSLGGSPAVGGVWTASNATLSGFTINSGAFSGAIAAAGATITGGTFSGITLSGTIAGTPTLSGNLTLGAGGSNAYTLTQSGTGTFAIQLGAEAINFNINSSTANSIARFTGVASGVNGFRFTDAAALGQPTLTTIGTDTNVNLALACKGTCTVRTTSPFRATSTVEFDSSINQAGFASVFAGSDNGTPGTTLGYFFGGSFSGTTTGSGPDLFRQTIASDTVSTVPGGLNGWSFNHNYGPVNGSRRGMQITMTQAGAVTDGSGIGTTQFYTVFQPQSAPNFDGAGVAASETINTNNVLHAGATNWSLIDIEQDIAANAGTNPTVKVAQQVGLVSGDAAPGTIIDTAKIFGVGIATGATNPTRGFRSLWQLGKGASQWVLEPTIGELFKIYPQTQANASLQQTRPATALRGFNLSKANWSDAAWWSPGAWIGGDGTTRLTRLEISDGTNGPLLDATLSSGAYSSVGSGGANYQVGDQPPDRMGGILLVDAVDGSGGVTLAHYVRKPFVKSGATVVVATAVAAVASSASTTLIVGDAKQVAAGDTVVATGVPGATTVSIVSGNTLTLSGAATVAQFAPIQFTRTMTPANPVAFPVGGTGNGALTINVTWTAATEMQIGTSVNTIIGTGSALATNATNGFLLIPSMAGTPTGNVGALGKVALVWDSTNKKVCTIAGATVECSAAFTP